MKKTERQLEDEALGLGVSGATEAGVIAELARAAAQPQVVEVGDGRRVLVTPPGYTVTDVEDDDWQSGLDLKRVDQDVTLQTTDSLVDYANRFKTGDTVLFADISANSITAVVDYHAASDGDVAGGAARGQHRASMVLPFSEEWKTWAVIDKKLMGQLAFARFLEENSVDVVAPDAASLIECCRDLQARRSVNFTKAVRTSSNNENFEFTDETNAATRGGVELPTQFKLSLPVYFGGESVTLMAFLRWELKDSELLLGVQLHRPEHVRQAVFKQIVLDVGDRTERQVVFGKL